MNNNKLTVINNKLIAINSDNSDKQQINSNTQQINSDKQLIMINNNNKYRICSIRRCSRVVAAYNSIAEFNKIVAALE